MEQSTTLEQGRPPSRVTFLNGSVPVDRRSQHNTGKEGEGEGESEIEGLLRRAGWFLVDFTDAKTATQRSFYAFLLAVFRHVTGGRVIPMTLAMNGFAVVVFVKW